MSTLAPNDRMTVAQAAIPGQTDFPADFPLPEKDATGQYPGIYVERIAGSDVSVLDRTDFTFVNLTVQPNGETWFSIRLNEAADGGETYRIYGRLDEQRATTYLPGGAPRSDRLEAEATRQAMALQELRRDIDRAVCVRLGEDGFNLPKLADRAGRMAQFDAQGRIIGGMPVTEFNGLLASINAAVAQAQAYAAQAQAAYEALLPMFEWALNNLPWLISGGVWNDRGCWRDTSVWED